MDNLKDPGVALGSLGLIAIGLEWVYIQRQIDELHRKIGDEPKDCGVGKDIEDIKATTSVFDRNFKSLIERINLHEMVFRSFEKRIVQLESLANINTSNNNNSSNNDNSSNNSSS